MSPAVLPRHAKAGSVTFAVANYAQADFGNPRGGGDAILGGVRGSAPDNGYLRGNHAWGREHGSQNLLRDHGGKSADPKYKLEIERRTLAATSGRSNLGLSGGTGAGSISFRQMQK